jgi:glycosyltransferase involved in cell wall biosynthesis
LYRGINSFLKSYFTRTVAVSYGIAGELIKDNLRPSLKVEVVHLGIRPLYQADAKDLTYVGLKTNAPVIGTLSRLSTEKGLERFIRAAALVLKDVPAARFVICGQGPDERPLKALAKELLIDDRLEFKPFPGREDIKDLLQTYDIYVLSSLREGLPTSLLEAMSMGRPSVASDIDGVREVITNGVDGVLVDTADIQAFAGKIIDLCHDVPQAIDMGRRGLDKVRFSFSVEGEMQRLREIYDGK